MSDQYLSYEFQEKTADRIVHLFNNNQKRVLLADEVGLGKTIVAKRVIEKLRGQKPALRVVYVCSNLSIAGQNVKKLGLTKEFRPTESRLSLLAYTLLEGVKNDFCIPITPGTSLRPQGSGVYQERAFIYALCRATEWFKKHKIQEFFLQNKEKDKRWIDEIKKYEKFSRTDRGQGVISKLNKKLREKESLIQKIRDKDKSIFSELRCILSEIGLDIIKPDLIIMDEFQRFSEVLTDSSEDLQVSGDDEELSEKTLAQPFLNRTDTSILLLSATPYRLFSTLDELRNSRDGGHFEDFNNVMRFLFQSEYDDFGKVWGSYRECLKDLNEKTKLNFLEKKKFAEEFLYRAICRTERETEKIKHPNHQFLESAPLPIGVADIKYYMQARQISDEMKIRPIPIDYIKSCPYLFSFMDKENYVEKRTFEKVKKSQLKTLKKDNLLLLPWDDIENFRLKKFYHAKLKNICDRIFEDYKGVEELLWIPPIKPYYSCQNTFTKCKDFSKYLVFSKWTMVPKMLACLLSYEYERRLHALLKDSGTYTNYHKEHLTDDGKKLLNHISSYLVDIYKPYEKEYQGQALTKIIQLLSSEIKKKIKPLSPIQMRKPTIKNYIKWLEELDAGNKIYAPKEVAEFFAYMAIGSPVICCKRVFGDLWDLYCDKFKGEWATFFNKPIHGMAVDAFCKNKSNGLEQISSRYKKYYEKVFLYCAAGNFQSMIEEYFFTVNKDVSQLIEGINLPNASLTVSIKESRKSMRTHFSVGYYQQIKDEKGEGRISNLRSLFNSPFPPFVLSTTSIGQEGLDFHLYCQNLIHWNLPSNPVDLEQREGRINRYRSHAIRKNIAAKTENKNFDWETAFNKLKSKNPLYPNWVCDGDFEIQTIVPFYPFSKDIDTYRRLKEQKALYRLTLGHHNQEDLINKWLQTGFTMDKECLFCLAPHKKVSIENFTDLSPFIGPV